jgi:hypothetical protein
LSRYVKQEEKKSRQSEPPFNGSDCLSPGGCQRRTFTLVGHYQRSPDKASAHQRETKDPEKKRA